MRAVNLPGATVKTVALFGFGLVVLAALGLLAAALLTGHDPTQEPFAGWLQAALVVATALGGVAGLGGAVQSAHQSISSKVDAALAAPSVPPPGNPPLGPSV